MTRRPEIQGPPDPEFIPPRPRPNIEALKPCAHCGGKPELNSAIDPSWGNDWYVYCENSGTTRCDSRELALDTWQRRAGEEALAVKVAALEARMVDYDRIVKRAFESDLGKRIIAVGGHRAGRTVRGLKFALLAIRARGLVRGAVETLEVKS